MARNYFLTTNPLIALSDPDAVLATPLNLLSAAHRYDDSGNLTASIADIGLKNIHTILIPPGDSAPGETDTLRGTSGNDVVFWDFQTLSGISISLSLLARVGLPSADQGNIIERFDLGDGNDLINLTYNAADVLLQPSPGAYTANATIFGGEGDDVVWSGAGNDQLFGDNGGDWLDGGAGNDTIYGGTGGGDGDSLMGGTGDDTLFGGDSVTALDAGAGSDWVGLDLTSSSYVLDLIAGANDGSDGADTVITTGLYGTITSSLGAGPDIFIGSSSAGAAPKGDIVLGQDGSDLIATYDGSDTLDGGADSDALWGGAGADTIFGGAGDDVIYMGPGDADISYGGDGADLWYLFRNDGAGNQIYDSARQGQPASNTEASSALIVGGDPAPNEGEGSDFIQNGTGLRETDYDVMDNAGGDDMVWVHQIGGTLYQLDVAGGTGTIGMSVQFDARDVPNIVLWDNDAVLGQVQQLYTWNGSDGYDHWLG